MNLKNLVRNFLWVLILVFSGPSFAYEGLTVRIGYAQGLELYNQSSILKETVQYLQKTITNYRFELLPISSVDTQEDIRKEKIDFLPPATFSLSSQGESLLHTWPRGFLTVLRIRQKLSAVLL